GADLISPLELLHDLVREHVEFDGIRIDQRARDAFRIAVLIRIGSIGWRHSAAASNVLFRMRSRFGASQAAAVGRFVGIEHLLAEWRERRHVVAIAAVAAIAAGAASAVSAWCAIAAPDAGQVVFIVRFIRIGWIPGHDAPASFAASGPAPLPKENE